MFVRELVEQLSQLPETAYVEFECQYPTVNEAGEPIMDTVRLRVDDVDLEELSGNVVLR